MSTNTASGADAVGNKDRFARGTRRGGHGDRLRDWYGCGKSQRDYRSVRGCPELSPQNMLPSPECRLFSVAYS